MRPLTREESLMLGLGTPEVVSHGRQAATSSTLLMAVPCGEGPHRLPPPPSLPHAVGLAPAVPGTAESVDPSASTAIEIP